MVVELVEQLDRGVLEYQELQILVVAVEAHQLLTVEVQAEELGALVLLF